MVSAIAVVVPEGSIDFWRRRLVDAGVAVDTARRFGEPVLRFSDPHGPPLELIGTPTNADSPNPKPEISGFHSATMLLDRISGTQAILVEGMGMTRVQPESDRYRFSMADTNAPGHLLDVLVDPSAPTGRPGGTIHHIAFRTRDGWEQQAWRQRLGQHDLAVSDIRDRKYFRSIYFNEPGGMLFEIATDPPGFAVDENNRHLGTNLMLPFHIEVKVVAQANG